MVGFFRHSHKSHLLRGGYLMTRCCRLGPKSFLRWLTICSDLIWAASILLSEFILKLDTFLGSCLTSYVQFFRDHTTRHASIVWHVVDLCPIFRHLVKLIEVAFLHAWSRISLFLIVGFIVIGFWYKIIHPSCLVLLGDHSWITLTCLSDLSLIRHILFHRSCSSIWHLVLVLPGLASLF